MNNLSKLTISVVGILTLGYASVTYINAPAKPIEKSVQQQLKDMDKRIDRLFNEHALSHNNAWKEFRRLNVQWEVWQNNRTERGKEADLDVRDIVAWPYKKHIKDKIIRQYERYKLVHHNTNKYDYPYRVSLVRYKDNMVIDCWLDWKVEPIMVKADKLVAENYYGDY